MIEYKIFFNPREKDVEKKAIGVLDTTEISNFDKIERKGKMIAMSSKISIPF